MDAKDIRKGVRKRKDLTGQTFERLTVISFGGIVKSRSMWFCKCECGSLISTMAYSLLSGNTKSCGCLQKDIARVNKTKHRGIKNNPREYRIWCGIITRCYNPNGISYSNYGGRGIAMSDSWRHNFLNFISDMGDAPTIKHTIDRIDPNGNYCKENCRWATAVEQANNKRSSVFITLNGETKTIAMWGKLYGINNKVFKKRANQGLSFDEIIKPPQFTGAKLIIDLVEAQKMIDNGFAIRPIANHFKVDFGTIKNRINKGLLKKEVTGTIHDHLLNS